MAGAPTLPPFDDIGRATACLAEADLSPVFAGALRIGHAWCMAIAWAGTAFAAMALAFSVGARAQTTPPAGTITVIPELTRLDADGDGSPDAALVVAGLHQGFCGTFALAIDATAHRPDNVAEAEDLLDDQTPSFPCSVNADCNSANGGPGGSCSDPDGSGPTPRICTATAPDLTIPDRTFRELLPLVDLSNDTNDGYAPYNLNLPWEDDCTSQGGDRNGQRMAIRLRGNLHVASPGVKTLLILSDDGYSLRVGGQTVAEFDGNRVAATDTRRISFAEAGVYPVELVYWDQSGQAVLEAFFAEDARCFSGTTQATCGSAGADDLSDVALLPGGSLAGFSVLSSSRVAPPTWAGVDDTCADRLGLPSEICQSSAAIACGNGTVEATTEAPEQCDDGNLTVGDGCTATCQLEPGAGCVGAPSQCSTVDTDGDGLVDLVESLVGLDPADADSDGDGWCDGSRSLAAVCAAGEDQDGDGRVDIGESDPRDPCDPDSDAVPCPTGDPDADGADNATEAAAGTDPLDADTDDDGEEDGDELAAGDLDGDGTGDALESALTDGDLDGVDDERDVANQDPCVPAGDTLACASGDFDGDGVANGAELAAGTDPTDPCDPNPASATCPGGEGEGEGEGDGSVDGDSFLFLDGEHYGISGGGCYCSGSTPLDLGLVGLSLITLLGARVRSARPRPSGR